jgi:hypothetical protein
MDISIISSVVAVCLRGGVYYMVYSGLPVVRLIRADGGSIGISNYWGGRKFVSCSSAVGCRASAKLNSGFGLAR